MNNSYEYKLKNLQDIINKENVGLVVTGGCPTFGYHFNDTIKMLNKLDYSIANVESNGYRLLDLIKEINPNKNVHYMYSPKIFSKNELEQEIEKTSQLGNNKNVFFKIVYQENELIEAYLNYISTIRNINQRVYLMPEGKTRDEILKNSTNCSV